MITALVLAEETISTLSGRLRRWHDGDLARDEAGQELRLWLEGLDIDLPPSTEPYQLIAQAVIEADAFEPVVALTSEILWQWVDEIWRPLIADRAQYNLLHLCAELRQDGNLLSEPIWALFEKQAVIGDYRGSPLRSALLAAMIYNQPDQPQAQRFWRDALEGHPDPYLKAKVVDGFRGLIRWPGLARFSAPELESYLADVFRELWRTATQISRTDLAWNEFRRLLETHPAVSPDHILDQAGIPEAAQVVGRMHIDVSDWLTSKHFEPETAEHFRQLWRRLFEAVTSDALERNRTRCQILEKLRMLVRAEFQAECRQPSDGRQVLDLLTFIYNCTDQGYGLPALRDGLTVARAAMTFAASTSR